MALYPCDIGEHRFPGRQQTIYPALVNGGRSERRKLRLCPAHFDALLALLETHAYDAYETDGLDLEIRCMFCRDPEVPLSWGFFATVYADRQERRDFWGSVHDRCIAPLNAEWALRLDMP